MTLRGFTLIRHSLAVALATLLLLPCTAAETAPPQATDRPPALAGRVLDPQGLAVAGATVRGLPLGAGPSASEPISVKSAADGTFSFAEPRRESWRVRVEASDFAPWNLERALAAEPLEIRLAPGRPVTGRIVDAASGRGIPGARVRLSDPGAAGFPHDAVLETIADEAGGYRFSQAAEGRLQIAAVAPASALATMSLLVAQGETTHAADLPLHPGARVAGRVRTSGGAPVKGATVRIVARGSDRAQVEIEPRSTGRDGAFLFEGVRAGTPLLLTVEHDDFLAPPELPMRLVAGKDRNDLRIMLVAGATLRFRLLGAEQRPVEFEGLSLEPLTEEASDVGPIEILRDALDPGPPGQVSFSRLAPGSYEIEIRPEEGQYVLREVTLVEGQLLDLGVLEVLEGHVLSGRVKDEEGSGIDDALVSVIWKEGARDLARQTRTTKDGRFRIRGLGDESLSLTVTSRWFARHRSSPVEPDEAELEITLERAGAIRGTVVAADGGSLQSVRLRALLRGQARTLFSSESSREIDSEVELDRASGEFTLLHLAQDGVYTVEAQAEGYAPSRKDAIVVERGSVADAGEILLERGVSLRGRVVRDEDGRPVPGAEVRLEPPGVFGPPERRPVEEVASTDTEGQFELTRLSPGTFALHVDHADYAPAEVLLDLGLEHTTEHTVEVRLSSGGEITGTVRDRDRQPVAGENIVLIRGLGIADVRSISTDDEGKYRFSRLAAGSYSIGRSTAGSAVPEFKAASVADGETIVVDFGDRATIRLSGLVQSGGEVLPHMRLAFIHGDGMTFGDIVPAESDATGHYEVGLEQPGPYAVSVMSADKPGRTRNGLVRIEVPDEPDVTLDIVLESGRIAGRVVDVEGRAISNAAVQVWPAEGGESSDSFGKAHTQEDGTFEVLGLHAGTYSVGVSADGFAPASAGPLTIGAETPASVEIVLERGRSVQGLVLDPRGGPVAGATVEVSGGGTVLFSGPSATTDAQGRFRVNVSQAGAVNMLAVADGWAPAWIGGWTGDPDSSEGPTIVLSEGGRVRVEILDGAGRPVAGVVLLATPEGDSWSWLIPSPPISTDTLGRGVFVNLAPGPYLIRAVQSEKSDGVAVEVTDGGEASVRIVLGGGT